MKRIYTLSSTCLLFLLGTAIFTSCHREDLLIENERERILRNGSEFLKNNYDFSLFNAAVELTGLDELLRDNEANYTIFAPTNAAFNGAGVEFPSDFEKMDRDSLRFMLEYHILPTDIYLNDIGYVQVDQLQENLTGRYLHLGRAAKQWEHIEPDFYVNGVQSQVANNNVNLSNGVLHGLNRVLKYHSVSVRSYLEMLPDHTHFVALLKKFGYWERLDDDTQWTIFAPTNSAMITRGFSLEAIAELNPDEYNDIELVSGYVHADQHLFTSDWAVISSAGGSFRQSRIGRYTIDTSGNAIVVRVYPQTTSALRNVSIDVATSNHKADNGVIHSLGNMLVFPAEARR